MLTCKQCGHRTTIDYVGLVDECPSCHTSPFLIARDPAR